MDKMPDLYTEAGPVRVSKPGETPFERPPYERSAFLDIYKAGREKLRKLKASGEWNAIALGSPESNPKKPGPVPS